MEPQIQNLSVLIIGYDPYFDIWPYFDYFFKKNFSECHIPSFFITCSRCPVTSSGYSSIKTDGDMKVTSRLKCGLSSVNTDYVLVLLDDYIISKQINVVLLGSIVDEMKKRDFDYCELCNFIAKPKMQKERNGHGTINTLKRNQKYLISLQPAIWKKDFLLSICDNDLVRPWDMEVYLDHCFSFEGERQSLPKAGAVLGTLSICNFVDKGEITRDALKLIQRVGLPYPSRDVEKRIVALKKRIINFASSFTPRPIRRFFKKVGKLFGAHFFTDN